MKRLKLFFLSCFLLGTVRNEAQIIMTYAGGGTVLGDGGPAVNAQTMLPSSGYLDSVGNYYFWHNLNSPRVRKVDTSGIITTVAGTGIQGFSGDGGLATNADIGGGDIAVDKAGNIYISDYYHYRIRRVDVVTGFINTIAGNGTATSTGDGGLAINATLTPLGICCDDDGNIYVCDAGKVRKINKITGIISTVAGNGSGGFTGDGGPALQAGIAANHIRVDAQGNLIIGCGFRIRKVNNNTGIINTIAGNGSYPYLGDGMPATSAQFREYGIAIDTHGNIFIADEANDRAYKIDSTNIFHLIAGNGVAGFGGDGGNPDSAKLLNPEGIAVDRCGNIYIADDNNNRIRKIVYDSTCSYSNIIDTTDTTMSIRNIASTTSISIYPNPAKEQVTITGGNGAEEVMIINAIGQLMQQQQCSGYIAYINVSGLKAGIYYLITKDEKSGKVVRMKFLKE